MTEGSVIYLHCDICDEETPHRILKGRLDPGSDTGFDGTVQCVTCRTVRHAHVEMERPIKVNSVLSRGDRSERTSIEFYPSEMVKVGEEFFWDEHNLLVTSIESGGKRVKSAEASSIDCLWLKYFDTVELKVAVVEGANTRSNKIEVLPEEEFAVGDLIELGKRKVVVTKIKISGRMVYREGSPVEARDIKRVYTKAVKERYH